jgi:hypothetical protein
MVTLCPSKHTDKYSRLPPPIMRILYVLFGCTVWLKCVQPGVSFVRTGGRTGTGNGDPGLCCNPGGTVKFWGPHTKSWLAGSGPGSQSPKKPCPLMRMVCGRSKLNLPVVLVFLCVTSSGLASLKDVEFE